jgi:rhodanese-related sulfurtransferase
MTTSVNKGLLMINSTRPVISFFLLVTSNLFFTSLAFTSTALAEVGAYRSPETVEGAETISVEQAKSMFDRGAPFVDVRNPRFYANGHIPGAHHLDYKYNYDESKLGAIVDKQSPVVVYCSGVVCSRSYRASEKAVAWGFENVKYFRGGFADWEAAGLPVEKSATQTK